MLEFPPPQFVVQPLSHVRLFATPWTVERQDPLSSTVSRSLLQFMPIESEVHSLEMY